MRAHASRERRWQRVDLGSTDDAHRQQKTTKRWRHGQQENGRRWRLMRSGDRVDLARGKYAGSPPPPHENHALRQRTLSAGAHWTIVGFRRGYIARPVEADRHDEWNRVFQLELKRRKYSYFIGLRWSWNQVLHMSRSFYELTSGSANAVGALVTARVVAAPCCGRRGKPYRAGRWGSARWRPSLTSVGTPPSLATRHTPLCLSWCWSRPLCVWTTRNGCAMVTSRRRVWYVCLTSLASSLLYLPLRSFSALLAP